MKKSLLALAALGMFAGAAMAQSSVTLYGLIDENIGKDVGSTAKRMGQGASSRLGFRGVEDLGGGMQAFFQIEHRFTPYNGQINPGNATAGVPGKTFWQARSYVGLRGGFGDVRLGREYNAAFFHGEVVADPWGWDTVASQASITGGGVTLVNVNRAITYTTPNMGGFGATVQVAEADENGGLNANTADGTAALNSSTKRPYSFGASYAGGPLSVGFGYANPGNVNDNWLSLRGSYDLGAVKLWGFIGNGKNTTNAKVKTWMLAATAPLGNGELRAALSQRKVATVKDIQMFAVGYHYSLSKRTVVYADLANNSKAATSKTGYDFGVKHSF
jgi:predicted porin